jgi:hypothetical protein
MATAVGRILVVALLLPAVVECNTNVTVSVAVTPPGEKKEFYIATIIPSLKTSPKPFPFVIERVSPGIDIAMETVIEKNLIPPSYRLVVSYADSLCDSASAMNEAIKFFLMRKVCIIFSLR